MDQVDSLNEMALQSTPMANVGVSVNNVPNVSQVIAVAADLPSFQYFISEQAKSILALQELQNEVGALLEFRDLVMEAFPQLGQKVQNMQSQNAISPSSKWEPGVRVKRKLGQQLRGGDSDVLVPSLLPRYRSNSLGKASRSSEISGSATSSSAIQDSGFCTESSKDHLSALSSRSKSRDTADELFSLLDNIHNKGTRLKLEVEYLWNRLNHKEEGGSPAAVAASGDVRTKRRCKSLDDLIVLRADSGASEADANDGAQSFGFEYAVKTALLEAELNALKRERDKLLKKLSDIENEHLANQAQTNRLLAELETMSTTKNQLEERLQVAISAENSGSAGGGDVRSRADGLQPNFLMCNRWRDAQTPFAKCQLLKLEQVFRGSGGGAAAADSVADAAAVVSNSSANAGACVSAAHAICTSAAATVVHGDSCGLLDYKQMPSGVLVERPTNPVTKELMSSATSYLTDGGAATGGAVITARVPDVTFSSNNAAAAAANITNSAASIGTLANTKEFGDAVDHKLSSSTAAGCGISLGQPDVLVGFTSGHPLSFDVTASKQHRSGGGVTLSKEKVISILSENDPKTLHCFLLMLSYQVEALNVHVQRISKSRTNIFRQLNRYKFENEDLRLELKKKEIELEGTKAQKRVLEQKRGGDVKLSYSTSDLMMTSMTPKSCALPDPRSRCVGGVDATTSAYACSVSDSALVVGVDRRSTGCSAALASRGAVGGTLSAGVKCADLARESGVMKIGVSAGGGSGAGSGAIRRGYSKIPLKTYSSRQPTKLNNSSGKKTLTSFKEYSAPGPPHSSCISSTSTSSSLIHK